VTAVCQQPESLNSENCCGTFPMSDIFEIELAYDATCKERGVDKHPMIQEMFTVDEEENLM